MRPKYPLSAPSAFAALTFLILFVCGGAPARAQQVAVTAADPPSAAQGSVNLNVKIMGKGFKNGARANFFVSGTTDAGGVQVNSTTFVGSTELSANITVSDTAAVSNFDIQVLNADGRGGKGTELFAVTAKAAAQISCGADVTNLSISIFKYTDATNTTAYNMQPDLTNPDGSPVPYVSSTTKGTKGSNIDGRIQIDNCTYDLTLNLNFSKRYFMWKFPNGSAVGTSVNTYGFNIDRVGNVPLTDGGTDFWAWCNGAADNYGGCGVDAGGYFVRRTFGSAVSVGNKAYGVRFNYAPSDNSVLAVAAGTAYVKIYHTAANTWTIMPDQVPPPVGVTDPSATAGEWSALLDKNTSPYSISSYQKMPLKIVVTRF